ncbi:hypothetical protein [Duganella sp.]|uniref:hypothetical protein n=1 Tax=Duganella sp. TaxID=1904440 RepID=UPI0031D7CEBD
MKPGKSPHERTRRTGWLLIAAAASLHLATALLLGDGGWAFRLGLCAVSLAPYAALAPMLRRRNAGTALLAGALLMLLLDAAAWYSVFIAPRHSTAALNLLAAPLCNLVFIAPAAIAAEALMARRRSGPRP